jgi:hypothetical protein
MKFLIGTVMGCVFTFSVGAVAANSYVISAGDTQNITEHTKCRKVKNNSGKNIMVPTKSSAEWDSFIASPPSSVTVSSCSGGTPQVSVLTSGTSWTVPSDWNSSDNKVECIGGGGAGTSEENDNDGGGGGGGGAYTKKNNLSLTPGASVSYQIGQGSAAGSGNDGTDSWFVSSATLLAKGGKYAVDHTGALGGSSTASVGDVKYAGGNGGDYGSSGGGGGGGGAGPNGKGGNGGKGNVPGGGGGGNGGGSDGFEAVGSTTGGNGGDNYSGSGGGVGKDDAGSADGTDGGGGGGARKSSGGNGGNGTDLSASAGSGGGGGGTRDVNGGSGGSYGGGGAGTRDGNGGSGANGVCVVTYTP